MKTELEKVLKKLKKARKDDLPRTQQTVFSDAVQEFLREHDHLSLCELIAECINQRISLFSTRDDSPTDLLIDAVYKGLILAEEDGNRVMIALYHFLAGKWTECYWRDDAGAQSHFKQAMAEPQFLADVRTDQFDWIKNYTDCEIFDNSLLGFIGIETKNYATLYDFYKNTDNREAECCSLIRKTIADFSLDKDSRFDDDDLIDLDVDDLIDFDEDNNEVDEKKEEERKPKYKMLMGIICKYGDLPVVCEAVECRQGNS